MDHAGIPPVRRDLAVEFGKAIWLFASVASV
jgi:hypothetical protein